MSSQNHNNGDHPRQEPLAESWREVGDQIQGLVSRIANVFRDVWSEERTEEPTFGAETTGERFEDELRSSADRMERVFRRVAAETEEERSKAMKSTREASERTLSEIRVVAARGLRALNEQLDDLAKTLDQERAAREKEQMYEPPAGDNPTSTNGHNHNHSSDDEG